jgi:hypothetical protein
MEDIAVAMAAMLSDMPRSAMLRADTVPFGSAVDVVTILRGVRTDSGAVPDAHMPGMAAGLGEVITDIHTMDTLVRSRLLRLGL